MNQIKFFDSPNKYQKTVEWDVKRALEYFNLIKTSKELYMKGCMIIPLYCEDSVNALEEKGFKVSRYNWAINPDGEKLYKIYWEPEEQA